MCCRLKPTHTSVVCFHPLGPSTSDSIMEKRIPCNPELASLCAARGGARIPLGVPRSVGRTVLQHSSASLGEARTQRRSYAQEMEAKEGKHQRHTRGFCDSPRDFDAPPRHSGGPPQTSTLPIHHLAPLQESRRIKLASNYLPLRKCTSNSPPHTRALMTLLFSLHAKVSSEVDITHVCWACGSQNVPSSLVYPVMAGSFSLLEASDRSIPLAPQPMTIPQAQSSVHSHSRIATANRKPLTAITISSPLSNASIALSSMAPTVASQRELIRKYTAIASDTTPTGITWFEPKCLRAVICVSLIPSLF